MNISKLLCIVAVAVAAGFAQTYNISGIVTDTGTTPIAGAVVRLEKAGLTATSGADGRFTLSKIVGIGGSPVHFGSQQLALTLQNGFIRLNLQEQAVVRVSVYSIQGRLLSTIQKTIGSGMQSMPLQQAGTGVYLYRVKIGKKMLDVRGLTLDGKQNQGTEKTLDGGAARHAKIAAAINDVIAVTRAGFLNNRVTVTNSDTNGIIIRLISQDAGTVTDIEGNVYHAIRIGNQIWMAENLRTTKYNDGTPITLDTGWNLFTDSAKYCYYGNLDNPLLKTLYGPLYNWYAVNTKKLAPAGWHVPSKMEWDTLQNYLIKNGYNWDGTIVGNKIAKSLASTSPDWDTIIYPGRIGNDPNKNNSTGFSALPGGERMEGGRFLYFNQTGYWWSSTVKDFQSAFYYNLQYAYEQLNYNSNANVFNIKEWGFSVRLVKD